MTGRLSKLQQWILQETLQYGTEQGEEGVMLLRKQLLKLWRREHYPYSEIWACYQDDYQSQRAEWFKTLPKLNVSLTRSIVSLRSKGLVRTFKLDRPDVDVWMLGNALRVSKFAGPLFLDEKQKVERVLQQALLAN